MKTIRKCKSVLDQKFKKTRLAMEKDIGLKYNKEDGSYFLPTLQSNKSESNINRNLLASDDRKSDSSSSDSHFIPTPKTPKQPQDILRKSLIKLKSTYCKESLMALRDVVQISRFNPQLLEKSMPIVYKGITTLLKSLRPATARTACQAANELFMNVSSVQGREFEDLIYALLQKTADGNKYVKKDALEALDSMVIHVPPNQSVKVLLHRKIAGCSLAVRMSAAKLLSCIGNILGTDAGITVTEDTKTSLVLASIRFIQDDCHDIRFHGIRLATMLLQYEDYEAIFHLKVNDQILKKLQKIKESVKSDLRP